jgi:hypothetical protein
MKSVWNSLAIAAALAIATPAWAQTNPSAGNPVGTLGPNPGGPGLTPYTGGAPAPAANSAVPPVHPHGAYHHARAMHHFHREMARKAALSGDTTAQLNREELARIQSGNLSNPPSPPAASAPPPPGAGGPPPGGPGAPPPGNMPLPGPAAH